MLLLAREGEDNQSREEECRIRGSIPKIMRVCVEGEYLCGECSSFISPYSWGADTGEE